MLRITQWYFDTVNDAANQTRFEVNQGDNVPLMMTIQAEREDVEATEDENRFRLRQERIEALTDRILLAVQPPKGGLIALQLADDIPEVIFEPDESDGVFLPIDLFYFFSTSRLEGFYKTRISFSDDFIGFPDAPLQGRPNPENPKDLRVVGNFNSGDDVSVSLGRTSTDITPELPLWLIILKSTEALSFERYDECMRIILCGELPEPNQRSSHAQELFSTYQQTGVEKDIAIYHEDRFTPHSPLFSVLGAINGGNGLGYSKLDGYSRLRVATEAFLIVNCAVDLRENISFNQEDVQRAQQLLELTGKIDEGTLQNVWNTYVRDVNGETEPLIPYLALIRNKFRDLRLPAGPIDDEMDRCYGLLEEKFRFPCFLELIWSYWHEEAMLVQTLNAISLRFQNVSPHKGLDPLANMEIDPLRGVNNLLWGYIQDEQHRLTVNRRAMEYDHQYGFKLVGKAIRNVETADARSRFIEAFHNLLHLCAKFYLQEDDTTVVADGFPILNALRETHIILSEGSHNQFGEMPFAARAEMMMQQWILSRPEFREFLPTRNMVAYPEPWMDRVAAMNNIQGWTDVPINQFRQLAIYGEQILISIRFGDWSRILPHERVQAANWARFWRTQIQGYLHAYRAVTGADLANPPGGRIDVLPPPLHLQKRIKQTLQDRGLPSRPRRASLPAAKRTSLPIGLRSRKQLKSGR